MSTACGPESNGADKCSMNMAEIHFLAGDLAGAYTSALPSADSGDRAAMALLVQICEKAGDADRTQHWQSRLAADPG
jgi:thioredoxin-like negative regulator of GroEL